MNPSQRSGFEFLQQTISHRHDRRKNIVPWEVPHARQYIKEPSSSHDCNQQAKDVGGRLFQNHDVLFHAILVV